MAAREIPFRLVVDDKAGAVLERVRASAAAAAQRPKKAGA